MENQMYKYVRYIGILLWTVIRKPVGLVWFYAAVPFRKYARNVVYNYVLQNGVYLKRLLERPIDTTTTGHTPYKIGAYHGTQGGYINYRQISKVEYCLVYWLIWGWLDDDSNEDTFDKGHIDTILRGERLLWFPGEYLEDVPEVQYGNSFDLGDAREPTFHFWASTLWLWRNTAYNFKYMQWEENRPEMLFYHVYGGWEFGYLPSGRNKGRLVCEKVGMNND